jgi:16S rRNA U1498 N3-methylase RsmE
MNEEELELFLQNNNELKNYLEELNSEELQKLITEKKKKAQNLFLEIQLAKSILQKKTGLLINNNR